MIVSKRAEVLHEVAAKMMEVAGLMERLAAVEEEVMDISTGVNEKQIGRITSEVPDLMNRSETGRRKEVNGSHAKAD